MVKTLKLISPVAFLATKHVAFADRDGGDYYASHDMEDFITVIDGRENIVAEVNAAPVELRRYVVASIRRHYPATCRRTVPVSSDCRISAEKFAKLLR